MCNPKKLLTIPETADLLQMNPEVIRRWLRAGKLAGTKVGSDWRIPESSLQALLKPANAPSPVAENGPKMCTKFPKWLEFSGLPKHLFTLLGPMAWPVFKELIELDFEQGETEELKVHLDLPTFSDRLGYPAKDTLTILRQLVKHSYITLDTKHEPPAWCKVCRPVQTPRSILDIHFSEGGVKGAPEKAFESRCLRRYTG